MVAEELGVQGQPVTRHNHIKWKVCHSQDNKYWGLGHSSVLKELAA